ncbi:MAG: universal stress protein [Gemmatimonadetes bacterium]|nr:universal stress protein [Gemmatimonadota bacterium]
MQSSLLLATDFSPSSAAAFEEAHWLGERLGVTPEILHVAEDNEGNEWRHHPSARLWLATTGLEESAVITRSGIPWVEIVRRVQETSPALLVIGSHGQSGFHPLRLGSTAERLGSGAPCPVVLVSVRAAFAPRYSSSSHSLSS